MSKVVKTFNSDGKRICNVLDCPKKYHANGYCIMHNNRVNRYGDENFVKNIVDGRTKNFMYGTYGKMISRCYNPSDNKYPRYGGRGISVYPEWKDKKIGFWKFANWIEGNLGQKPSKEYTLDRINNNGDYEPGNLRWATPEVQSKNRGLGSTNKSGIKGVWFDNTHKHWISAININKSKVVLGRFKTIEEASVVRKAAELKYYKETA